MIKPGNSSPLRCQLEVEDELMRPLIRLIFDRRAPLCCFPRSTQHEFVRDVELLYWTTKPQRREALHVMRQHVRAAKQREYYSTGDKIVVCRLLIQEDSIEEIASRCWSPDSNLVTASKFYPWWNGPLVIDGATVRTAIHRTRSQYCPQ
jgi:hypothetical protein